MEIRKRKFTHTAAALAIYDQGAPARAAAWESIETNDDVAAAERAEAEALALVQEAFHKDTADINSRENCQRVDLSFMRRMVAEQ